MINTTLRASYATTTNLAPFDATQIRTFTVPLAPVAPPGQRLVVTAGAMGVTTNSSFSAGWFEFGFASTASLAAGFCYASTYLNNVTVTPTPIPTRNFLWPADEDMLAFIRARALTGAVPSAWRGRLDFEATVAYLSFNELGDVVAYDALRYPVINGSLT